MILPMREYSFLYAGIFELMKHAVKPVENVGSQCVTWNLMGRHSIMLETSCNSMEHKAFQHEACRMCVVLQMQTQHAVLTFSMHQDV